MPGGDPDTGTLSHVGDAEEVIESHLQGAGLKRQVVVGAVYIVPALLARPSEAEMPFSEAGGRIPVALEELGQRQARSGSVDQTQLVPAHARRQ